MEGIENDRGTKGFREKKVDRTPQDGNFLSLNDLMEGPEVLYLDWFSFSPGPPCRKCMQREL